jgi:hypothetical protein
VLRIERDTSPGWVGRGVTSLSFVLTIFGLIDIAGTALAVMLHVKTHVLEMISHGNASTFRRCGAKSTV